MLLTIGDITRDSLQLQSDLSLCRFIQDRDPCRAVPVSVIVVYIQMEQKNPSLNDFAEWLSQRIRDISIEEEHPVQDSITWEKSGAIAHEAGDWAARLGFPELYRKSRKVAPYRYSYEGGFDGYICTPQEAQCFLAECVEVCTAAKNDLCSGAAGIAPGPSANGGTEESLDALSVSDAAKELGVHPSTVRREVRRGKLNHYRVGNRIRFTQEQIIEYRRSQTGNRLACSSQREREVLRL